MGVEETSLEYFRNLGNNFLIIGDSIRSVTVTDTPIMHLPFSSFIKFIPKISERYCESE